MASAPGHCWSRSAHPPPPLPPPNTSASRSCGSASGPRPARSSSFTGSPPPRGTGPARTIRRCSSTRPERRRHPSSSLFPRRISLPPRGTSHKRSSSIPTIGASISCRSSTSMGSWPPSSRRSAPGPAWSAPTGCMRADSSPGCESSGPTWYTAVPTMHQGILARAADHRGCHRGRPAPLHSLLVGAASVRGPPRPRGHFRCPRRRGLRHDRGGPSDQPAILSASIFARPARSVSPPGPTSRSWPRQVSCCPAAPPARSSFAARTSPPATGTTKPPTPTHDVPAGSAPVTRARSTRTATSTSPAGSRKASTVAAKKSPRAKWTRSLLGHPGVRQAVCFAIPHVQLGEEIGAAVELEPGVSLKASELRAWARERLPAFKLPRIIQIVNDLHTSATGKVVRADLAARLGIGLLDDRDGPALFVAPRTPTETRVAAIWRACSPTDRSGSGRDSRRSAAIPSSPSKCSPRSATTPASTCPIFAFVEEGTIEALAADVDAAERRWDFAAGRPSAIRSSAAALLHPGPRRHPVRTRLPFASALPADQPVWAFDLRRLGRSATIEGLAARCLDLLPGPHGRRPGLADPQPAPLVDVPVRSAAAASAGELSAEAVRSPRRPAHLRPGRRVSTQSARRNPPADPRARPNTC